MLPQIEERSQFVQKMKQMHCLDAATEKQMKAEISEVSLARSPWLIREYLCYFI